MHLLTPTPQRDPIFARTAVTPTRQQVPTPSRRSSQQRRTPVEERAIPHAEVSPPRTGVRNTCVTNLREEVRSWAI